MIIFVRTKIWLMNIKEMNSYRLTSTIEPTDAMLSTLMKEVAKDAKRKSDIATDLFFKRIEITVRKRRIEWENKTNIISDK